MKNFIKISILFFGTFLCSVPFQALAQDDILDAIEAELKAEEEKKKAAAKASKNEAKYKANYEASIRKGDAYIRSKKYDDALEAFEEAKKWGPLESYPDQQIALARQEKTKQEAAEKQAKIEAEYNAAIKIADDLFNSKKYNSSIPEYQKAKQIDQTMAYPTDQIAEAKKLQAKLEEERKKAEATKKLEADYQAALDNGDELLKKNDFDNAIVAYQKAATLKPSEPAPKSKIQTAKKSKADAEAKAAAEKIDKEFTAAMEKADGLLAAGKYDESISAYKEAQKIKPADPSPKTKITEAEAKKKQAADAATKAKYDALIDEADNLLKNSQFDEAKVKYNAAAAVLPNETYPKTKAKECGELKVAAGKAELKAQYDALVKEADGLLEKEEFDAAKKKYQEALAVLPHETHPATMITEAESRKKAKATAIIKAQYDEVINAADQMVKEEKFDEAVIKYQEAKKILPNENHPDDMLLEIEKLKKQKANEASQTQFEAQLAIGEGLMKEEKFDEAIAAFEAAHKILPTENKTTELIAESKKLKEERKQNALQADFDSKVKEGESLLNEEQFDQAIAKFNEAAAILPANQKPKFLIEEVQKKRAEKEAAEALIKFNGLVAEGDAAMSSEDFVTARIKFNEASTIYKEGKNTIDKKLAELGQKENEKQNAEMAAAKEAEKQKKFDELVASANEKTGTGDYSDAMTALNQALSLYPENQEAIALKTELDGRIKDEKANAEKAAAADKLAKEEAAKASQINALITEAKSAANQQNFAQANSKITAALAIDNANSEALAAKSEIESKQKAFDDEKQQNAAAAVAQEKAQQEKLAKIATFISAGNQALASKDYVSAESSFNELLSIDPNNEEAKKKLAEVQTAKEQDQLAADAAKKAQAEKQAQVANQANIAQLITAGNTALKNGQFDNAITSYTEAATLDPNNSELSTKIANAKQQKQAKLDADLAAKQKQEAQMKAANAAKEKAAQDSKIQALIDAAASFETQSKFEDAKSKYQEVLSIDASNTTAASKIGELEAKIAKTKQQEQAKLAADLAAKKEQEEQLKAANDAKEKAELEAKLAGLLEAASNLETQSKLEEAKNKYQEILSIDASNTTASSKISSIDAKIASLSKEKAEAEAAKKAEKDRLNKLSAEKERKQKIASKLGIGDQMMMNKNFKSAIGAYTEVLEIESDNNLAKSKIAEAQSMLKKEEEKRRNMNALQKQEEIDRLLSEGQAAAVNKNFGQAKSKYDQVLVIDANNSGAKAGISAIQSQLDALGANEAAEQARKAAELEKTRKVESILDAGYDLFAGGQYDEAINKFKEGVDIAPTNQELKNAIHETLEQQTRLKMIMLAKKSNKPRPQPTFKTETIGKEGRTDKLKYQNELGNAYPEGVTETEKQEDRKKVTTRIVVKSKVGSEYKRITYDWGGKYYFKNGQSVGSYIWQYETRDPSFTN